MTNLFGSQNFVFLLLSNRANPNLTDAEGRTPLQYVIQQNATNRAFMPWGFETIKLLVQGGANVMVRDPDGNTLLHVLVAGVNYTVTKGTGTKELIEFCGTNSALLNATNNAGDTALHIAMRTGNRAKTLMTLGANPMVTNRAGEFPLRMAALKNLGSYDSVRPREAKTGFFMSILQRDLASFDAWLAADPGLALLTNHSGETSVQFAAKMNNRKMVDRLVSLGAKLDPDSALLAGRTAEAEAALVTMTNAPPGTWLLRAISLKNYDLAAEIVRKGADFNTLDYMNHSPLYFARQRGATNLVALLESLGAKENLFDAAESGNIPLAIELLGSNRALARATTKSGDTPLHCAAEMGHSEMVKLLLSSGADLHATNSRGYSPLHAAATEGYTNAIPALIAAGAKLTDTDRNGGTPLHTAVFCDQAEMAAFLISIGADVNAQTLGVIPSPTPPFYLQPIGNAPLHYAALKGNTNIVTLLLDHGAAINVTNGLGHTPLAVVKDRNISLGPIHYMSESFPAVFDGETRRVTIELLERHGGK